MNAFIKFITKTYDKIREVLQMVFDKTQLIAILANYVELKQQVAALTESVATLTAQVNNLQVQVDQYVEYAALLEDPEVVAAYEAAITALNS